MLSYVFGICSSSVQTLGTAGQAARAVAKTAGTTFVSGLPSALSHVFGVGTSGVQTLGTVDQAISVAGVQTLDTRGGSVVLVAKTAGTMVVGKLHSALSYVFGFGTSSLQTLGTVGQAVSAVAKTAGTTVAGGSFKLVFRSSVA